MTERIPSILTSIPSFYILTSMKGVKGILLMAGRAERFNDPTPKQFHLLQGKKIFLWTLEQFTSSQFFEEIILITNSDRVEEVQNEVGNTARVIPGGRTRQESSYRGLIACNPSTEIVVIHDGVRPFVSKRILEENIEGARAHGAVDTCIPSADTLVHAPNKKKITSIPLRSEFLRGQTPQSFSYPLILQAHEKTTTTHATDDCQLVLEMGKEIYIVEGEEENLKITTRQDLLLAEAKLSLTSTTSV